MRTLALMMCLALAGVASAASAQRVPSCTTLPERAIAGEPVIVTYIYSGCLAPPQAVTVRNFEIDVVQPLQGGSCSAVAPPLRNRATLNGLGAGTYTVRVIDAANRGAVQIVGSFTVEPAVASPVGAPGLNAIGFVMLMFALAAAGMIGLSRLG